jgi:very-short-patch-repair endonuclease
MDIVIDDNEETITCRICGEQCSRVYGAHLKKHGYTSDQYKKEFPGAPITALKDKKNTSKNSGKHMQTEKYRKMFSQMFKGENNPMHSSNTTEQFRKEQSPYSVEFYKKRFPDMNDQEIKDKITELANSFTEERLLPSNKEYWMKKGYSEEEAIEKVTDRQTTFSKEICIEKYGEEEGIKVWLERQEKWKKTLVNQGNLTCGYSKISQELFDEIMKYYKDDELFGIYYATYNKEYYISEKGNIFYQYDFTDLNVKKIIEFNGDLYHANPNIFESDDYYHPFLKEDGLTAGQKWEEDNKKIKSANKRGFDVLVIWESEYKKDKEKTIQKCIDFLKSK